MELDDDQWARFTPAEQLQHCRYMAAEAHRLSERGDGHANKIIYAGLSRRWLTRANQIQRLQSLQTEVPIPTSSLTRLWRLIRGGHSIRVRESGPE